MVSDLYRGFKYRHYCPGSTQCPFSPVEDIEPFSGILATDSGGFVKGIIKTTSGDRGRTGRDRKKFTADALPGYREDPD